MSEQSRIKTLASQDRVLVMMHNSEVYDVTDFLEDHPGGDELITKYANSDITHIMADETVHAHSEAAYEVLQDYYVGRLPTGESDPDSKSATDTEMDEKDNKPEEPHFIILGEPMVPQIWRAKWTREFYIEQVHKPHHYKYGSAPIFGNFLEPFTRSPWWLVPAIWLPVNYHLLKMGFSGLPLEHAIPLYIFGVGFWTLLEYALHRFLFHLDYHLPQFQVAYTIHFMLHGVHHFLPMDRHRLVMPPAVALLFAIPLFYVFQVVFRNFHLATTIYAGSHLGYIIYDCTHYFLHHSQIPNFMTEAKKAHIDHHYKDYEMGFGVTTKFWDRVFGTELFDTSPSRL